MKKETKIQVIIIFILSIILGTLIILVLNECLSNKNIGREMKPIEESVEKETKSEDVDEGIVVTKSNINLEEYSSNITINKSGEYTVTGQFKNTIIVNAEEEVTLILKNINIDCKTTAAIANISTGTLRLVLEDNTINTLSDGGSSEYDGCIYSTGELVIEGNGTLNVFGNQVEGEGIATETNNITINGGNINIECNDDGIDSNKDLIINGGNIYTIGSSVGGDAGIDTDAGFVINGGEVIALGSDMLESPKSNSTQKSICFNLKEKIESGSKISIKSEENKEIISFEAKEDFKTLIVSNSNVEKGVYYIYINGIQTENKTTIK